MKSDDLHEVCELLFGPLWQRATARALGPLHPDGARDSLDDSLVRKWARGARDIPDWVARALLDTAENRKRDAEAAAEKLRAIIGAVE